MLIRYNVFSNRDVYFIPLGLDVVNFKTIPVIKHDIWNPHFGSVYIDLVDITEIRCIPRQKGVDPFLKNVAYHDTLYSPKSDILREMEWTWKSFKNVNSLIAILGTSEIGKLLRQPLLWRPEVKEPKNDALRMLGNDLSPQRQILQWLDNDLSCGVVATTRV